MKLRMKRKDKLLAIGSLGAIIIIFLSIVVTPYSEFPIGVYKNLLYMGIVWSFFMFGLAPKLVEAEG